MTKITPAASSVFCKLICKPEGKRSAKIEALKIVFLPFERVHLTEIGIQKIASLHLDRETIFK